MCNPPFYESAEDMLTSAASKQRPPFTACTGSETEMVTPGGEVEFVTRMIDESLVLRERVQWYTSMLGKFSSVAVIMHKLKEKGVDNYAATEFVQGNKTRRWGVAWSFNDMRPNAGVARGLYSLPKALLPFPSEYIIKVCFLPPLCIPGTERPQVGSASAANIGRHLNETLTQLPLEWMWKPNISAGVGFTSKAVWSRASRRRASKGQAVSDDEAIISLGFKIHVRAGEPDGEGTKVCIRWLKGHDSVLFESFCGMVKRKLQEIK